MEGSERSEKALSSKPHGEVIKAFKLLDQDNDGKIKASEITELITSLGGDVECPNIKDLIVLCHQKEKCGFLELQDFIMNWNIFRDKVEEEDDEDEEEIQKEFRMYDIDGDGYITKEEMKTFLTRMGFIKDIEEEAEKCVADMDLDGDGRVSYAEFVAKWRTS